MRVAGAGTGAEIGWATRTGAGDAGDTGGDLSGRPPRLAVPDGRIVKLMAGELIEGADELIVVDCQRQTDAAQNYRSSLI